MAGRRRGPVLLAHKSPAPARQPAAGDIDPDSGRARLSYRRAATIFKTASGGRTLHKLRHSRLTHLAEAGEDVTLIKAKSRHRSLRSLERYVNPSNTAVARLTDRHDPNRRTPVTRPGTRSCHFTSRKVVLAAGLSDDALAALCEHALAMLRGYGDG